MQIICENAIDAYALDSMFLQVIESRENIVSTYFGHDVAISPPHSPTTDEPFVSSAI